MGRVVRELSEYGGLLIATRLRRLSDVLFAGVDQVYDARGFEVPSRCVPLLLLLRDNGPTSITDLARQLGQTHPAVSQLSRTLAASGLLVDRQDAADERRRLLALSPAAEALMERMADTWTAVVGAVEDLGASVCADLPALMTGIETALSRRDFATLITDRARTQRGRIVEVIPFEPRYRNDFKRLNVEWLEKYFYVEPIDEEVLSNPETSILKPGGHILLARHQGQIVGTCALIRAGRSRVELSKMAVTSRLQGQGVGRRLLLAAIAQFKRMNAQTLFLESSSRLTAALALYESVGFRHAPRPRSASHYVRSDVYMVYEPDAAGKPATTPRRRAGRRGLVRKRG
ncbi:MAG: bifunctional helix-turn-helix transcriptional regulator/GNAT family N-acetyltransferase [Vicinamibacterales bacterium]